MSNRRRSAPLAALTLSLVLLPGLSLAAGQRTHTRSVEESPLSALFNWAARTWEALTDRSPDAGAPAGRAWAAAGCGIDPNGTCAGGGGGTTTSSSGH
jgi:hypothetical protein